LVSSLLDEVRQFNPNDQQDDITIIVAHCRESLESDLIGENGEDNARDI
jgi:hypothetical protein